jgi:hypothetical protein
MGEADAIDSVATEIIAIITGALNIARAAGVAGPIDTARGSLRTLARSRPDVFELVSRQLIIALAELPQRTVH